jgi:uncharacterized damage-inducible protein DinB
MDRLPGNRVEKLRKPGGFRSERATYGVDAEPTTVREILPFWPEAVGDRGSNRRGLEPAEPFSAPLTGLHEPKRSERPMTPDAWLRGPVEGVIPELQPVAHSLIQAREDLERVVPMISDDELWQAPGGAASPGFHLRHLAGSTDRLLSYAKGAELDDAQRRHLATEKEPQPALTGDVLLDEIREAFARALEHLRSIRASELDGHRRVGKGELPSNVRGLLYHLGEHATRHVGQLITTLHVMRDRPLPPSLAAEPPDGRRGHAPGGALPHSRPPRQDPDD